MRDVLINLLGWDLVFDPMEFLMEYLWILAMVYALTPRDWWRR